MSYATIVSLKNGYFWSIFSINREFLPKKHPKLMENLVFSESTSYGKAKNKEIKGLK